MPSKSTNYRHISQTVSAFLTVAGLICPSAAALSGGPGNIASRPDRNHILPKEMIYHVATPPNPYDPLLPLTIMDDKGREVTFAAYSSLAQDWQQRINLKTYWNIDFKEREYLGDIMGKMESISLGNSTVLTNIGKVISFKNNKVTFEASREFFDLVIASPAFYQEPWIDSELFHRPQHGQARVFNLKSHGNGPPLHLIGLREGNRYLVEAHDDMHPDHNVLHGVAEVAAGIFGRHVLCLRSFWPNPAGIGEKLTKRNIHTGYTVAERPTPAPSGAHLAPGIKNQ